jgi:hypothetical protein
MSRLAEILKQEYQTKGIFAGAASALSKRSKEKMDIRNSLFGGSGLGSIIGRKVFGKGYSAISSDKSKVSNVSEAISSGSNTILQEVSISSKITAKNTLAMPAMARDMFLMKENMVKLVRLQGETPREKAGDFFSRQSAREAAFENKFNRPTTPTKVEQKKEGGGFLGGLLSILGTVGSVFKSILSPVSSLAGILGGLGLAAAAFGGAVWKILGFLAKTKIGKILGLSALALGATSVFAGNDTQMDPSESLTGNADEGMSFGTKAAIGVAGYGVAKAGIAGYGLAKQTGAAISNAKVASNPFVMAAEKSTPKAAGGLGQKSWQGFLKFLEKSLGKQVFAKIAPRLAVMGGLMAIPVVGWVGALINLGFNLYLAYQIYSLWKEYMGTPEEKTTSPSQVKSDSSIVSPNDIVQPFNYDGNSPISQNQDMTSPSAGGQGNYTLPKGKSISSNEAIDYLVKKGMTPAQAAGVVGNLIQESTLNSGAFNEAEGAYGLAQWRGSRLSDLQSFAASKGKSIEDVNTQLDFIMHELNGKESKAGRMLFASKTADEAAFNFGKYYERPKTVEQSRLSYATQSLAQYKPMGSSSVELAQSSSSGGGTMAGYEIMTASASAADGRMGNQSGGGTTNNIAVQSPAQQNQSQQIAMNTPSAFDRDLANLLLTPMSL